MTRTSESGGIMSSNTEPAINYNDNNYRSLMTELKSLSTFAAIADWDARARIEVERILSVIQ